MRICISYGQPTSGNKDVLVQRIRSGPKEVITHSVVENVLKKWFMKPLKMKSFSLGTVNEDLVMQGICPFLMKNNFNTVSGPHEVGLIVRETKPWLAASLDGVIQIQKFNDEENMGTITAAVEIKTMCTNKTITEATTRGAVVNGFAFCTFGDFIFKRLIPDVNYRIQVLHHATVMKLKHVVFFVADSTKNIYGLLVFVKQTQMDVYEEFIDKFRHAHLEWVYGSDIIPSIDKSRFGSSNYIIDEQVIRLDLELWKKLISVILQCRGPLPAGKYICPSIVANWNRVKGGVNVIS